MDIRFRFSRLLITHQPSIVYLFSIGQTSVCDQNAFIGIVTGLISR